MLSVLYLDALIKLAVLLVIKSLGPQNISLESHSKLERKLDSH